MRIEWLPGAILDLQRLRELCIPSISRPPIKAVTAIKAAVNLLTPHHYGKPVDDLPDFYDVIIPFGSAGYILRYRIETDIIFIVALKHKKEVDFSEC